MHMVVQPSREPLPRCKIFVHDPLPQQASLGVPDRYVPARWPHNQYAAEHYLWESLRSPDHPWRVARVEDADVVYLAFNHSMLCFAGKPNTLRRHSSRPWRGSSSCGRPKRHRPGFRSSSRRITLSALCARFSRALANLPSFQNSPPLRNG